MHAARAIQRIGYRQYGNTIIVIIIIRESVSVQPVVTVADQRAGWTGIDRQLVRYASAGRANAFIVIDDEDTTQTLDRETTRFQWPKKR